MSAPAPLQPLRVEQVVTYLRVFGLVAGVPTILLATFPGMPRAQLAWGIHVVLLLGTVALALWRRNLRPNDEKVVLIAGFALDAVVICGYVLAFTHLVPNVAWAMVFVLLADAALRFGVRGAVLGLVLSSLLYAAQAQAHAAATGTATRTVSYLYVLGTLAAAAAILAFFTVTLERQARMAQQQALALADANRVRDRLLAISSHEFRGSLAALTLASETVRGNLERLGPERTEVLLGEVNRHGLHLQRLVEDLFTVAQARSNAMDVRRRHDDLAASVQVALSAANRHRDNHVLTVSVDPVSCEIDHERLQQILRNLVENAYKYSPSGSRVLVIATLENGHLELRVGDEGPGIPAPDREQVFEPFSRRRGAAGSGESSGLGLYVVQQIVAALGGSLDLRTSSEGTEFVVVVPAEVSTALRAVPDRSATDDMSQAADSGAGRSVTGEANRR